MAVYFVRVAENGPVKIGSALNVKRRLGVLQVGNHETLTLLRQIPGGVAEERWLQNYFRPSRICREWFDFEERMLTIEVPPLGERKGRGQVVALRAHIRGAGIDSDQFGKQFNPPVSGSAVRKWIAGIRIPRLRQLAQIQHLTGGTVTTADFYYPAEAA
jgi:hypothetical protein